MKITFPKLRTAILITLFFVVLIASRLINLDKTARFIWDESSDLVSIHQIYVDRNLTLIGPISEDGSKVFGSLTYYMLLPFAIIGDFDPISTAYGAAFWGILTGALLLFLAYKINKKLVYLVALIIILWYPLVETGRWAWNPNLIPFFVTLAIIFTLPKKNFFSFLAGLSVGLSIHLHYLAIFSVLGLGIIFLKEGIKNRNVKKLLLFVFGIIIAIFPFVLFDLTHKPGLFLSRILYFNNMGGGTTFFNNLLEISSGTFFYFTQSTVMQVFLMIIFLALFIYDMKRKSPAVWYAIVFLLQIIGLSFVTNFYNHYILAAIPFFVTYLIFKRESIGKVLSITALSIILISGVFSFPKQISNVTWESNIASTRFITKTISDEISRKSLKNNNIAVLGSSDPNTYGKRYRDLLLIQNVNLLTKGEYEISDHLFVVSESSIETLRSDPSYEMKFFRSGELIGSWDIPESPWKVYLLSKSSI